MGTVLVVPVLVSLALLGGASSARKLFASNEWTSNGTDIYAYDGERCGLELPRPRDRRRRFITGGKDAAVGRYPWAVAIYRNGGYLCTGTLITKRHVITAAHCFGDKSSGGDCAGLNESTVLEEYSVWQGGICLPNAEDCLPSSMKEYKLARASFQHFYRSHSNCTNGDYGLLELAGEADPAATNHICLPHRLSSVANGGVQHSVGERTVITHGWGLDPDHHDSPWMSRLQVLEMRNGLWTREKCLEKLAEGPYKWSLPEDGICTDESKNGDTCSGDSGGGLITKDPASGRLLLLGVVSFGTDCVKLKLGYAAKAQVFSSVAVHAAEIEAFIAGNMQRK